MADLFWIVLWIAIMAGAMLIALMPTWFTVSIALERLRPRIHVRLATQQGVSHLYAMAIASGLAMLGITFATAGCAVLATPVLWMWSSYLKEKRRRHPLSFTFLPVARALH